jgi:uncharacterized membrane protein
MSSWLFIATALACALMGGVFFTFSSFVMPALGKVPVEEGIRAMQRINIDVYHWTFMGTFFATPIACIAAAAYAIWSQGWNQEAALYAILGCIVYVLGNFVVTAAGNVPLNNALAAVDAESAEAVRLWVRYLSRWTRWNHVRTVASMIAAGAFLFALKALGEGAV